MIISCTGKAKFKSSAQAHYIIDHRPNMKDKMVYKCKYCGFFHIGPNTFGKEKIKNSKRKERKENARSYLR